MEFLKRLISEEAEACIRNHTQYSWSESSVEGLQSFLTRDPHKHVHYITVPGEDRPKTYTLYKTFCSVCLQTSWFIYTAHFLLKTFFKEFLHFLWSDCHASTHHVKWVCEHGGCGACQRASQESRHGRQHPVTEKRTQRKDTLCSSGSFWLM